jgi:hypothetical protein
MARCALRSTSHLPLPCLCEPGLLIALSQPTPLLTFNAHTRPPYPYRWAPRSSSQGCILGMIGHTALHWAASKNHEQLATWLLSQGLPVNIKNNADSTPLHAAAQHGHMKMAQILLDAGADPTAQNDEDETPAALAEKRGHAPMVALLEQRNQARTAGGGLMDLELPSRSQRAWIGATVGVAALLVALAVAARSRQK